MGQIGGLLKEEMPREKLIQFGPNSLTNVELLAIILRTGTKSKNVIDLSREILTKFDLNVICRTSFEEFLKFSGVKSSKACVLVSLFELSRRVQMSGSVLDNVSFKCSKDIYSYVKSDFLHLSEEKVMIIYLNSRNKPIKKEFVFSGGFNKSYFDVKIVLKKILQNNCFKIIVVHNHPSGESLPSVADIDLTKKLVRACGILDIKVVDHLVVGRYYTSLFDRNLM
ncbi:MAG: DNA repair protein RadC [Nanoarchaeales archaeon]|nr:DNA repair protein RadC [Nanoarchaeales archaeon]